MRSFISINPDEDTNNKIFEIQQNVKEKISGINKNFLNSIKWETRNKFHLTVFFIGEVSESEIKNVDLKLTEIENEVRDLQMQFSVKCINAYPKLKFPRVIIIELENKDGNAFVLSETINSKLSETGIRTDKKFHPHITIGRVRRERKINLTGLGYTMLPEIRFPVSSFYIMKSELKSSGSEYTVLKKYELK